MVYAAIVISGTPCSGKSSLAREIGSNLGKEVYSIGKIFRAMWREKHPDGKVSFEDFWSRVSHEENMEADRLCIEKMATGNYIGDFRYARKCDGPEFLKVLVTADVRIRARRALQDGRYPGATLEEIRDFLKDRERDEVRVGQNMYGEKYDYRKSKEYHLVLNSGRLTLDQEVQQVLTAFGRV
jgi:cytidylate kinase